MTRIGIDARLTHYRVGGTSTYIRYLLEALEKLDHDENYIIFHSRKAEGDLGVAYRHAPLWTPCHHRLERLALSLELARFNLDVFHSPDFIPPLRGARRHVITVHDLAFLIYPEILTEDSRRYYNDQIKAATEHADHILAVSEATKRDIVERLDVPAHKITVQLHGVDPRFKPMDDASLAPYRQRFDLPERFILFVGTFEPRKNINGLLDAYTHLRGCLPDSPPLVMVGNPGWLIDDTLKRIEATPGVIVIDNADHASLPAIYNMAALLVLPAFYEGFGLPPLEAMACGTIPVVSDRASLPEVVGEVGLLVDPQDATAIADAMHQVLTADSAWLSAQQQAAIDRAATFTWKRSAEIARGVYQKVL